MRYYCYQLYVEHPLPQLASKVALAEQLHNEPKTFRLEIPVGIAIVPDSGDEEKWWLHLLETAEAFLWVTLLAAVTVDKASFLEALDTIHYPLCVHQTVCDCYGDVTEMLDYQRDEIEVGYMKACRALYLEVYGRN
jgi:hypothetical protein